MLFFIKSSISLSHWWRSTPFQYGLHKEMIDVILEHLLTIAWFLLSSVYLFCLVDVIGYTSIWHFLLPLTHSNCISVTFLFLLHLMFFIFQVPLPIRVYLSKYEYGFILVMWALNNSFANSHKKNYKVQFLWWFSGNEQVWNIFFALQGMLVVIWASSSGSE